MLAAAPAHVDAPAAALGPALQISPLRRHGRAAQECPPPAAGLLRLGPLDSCSSAAVVGWAMGLERRADRRLLRDRSPRARRPASRLRQRRRPCGSLQRRTGPGLSVAL